MKKMQYEEASIEIIEFGIAYTDITSGSGDGDDWDINNWQNSSGAPNP